jgi:hypothetical protein
MINIDYKTWYEIDKDNTHGFRKKDASLWQENDFTLFTRFRTKFGNIVKEGDENNSSCIIGKPGHHMGLYVTNDDRYKFDIWSKVGEEYHYTSIFPAQPLYAEDDFINVIVSHNLEKKLIHVTVYSEALDVSLQGTGMYKGDIIDYKWCPTYVGCAYHDKETGYPHNAFWSGEISYLKIIDKYMTKEEVEEIVYFDIDDVYDYENESAYFIFDGKRQTYSSVFDLSGNNNHLRYMKQQYMSKFNKHPKVRNSSQIV